MPEGYDGRIENGPQTWAHKQKTSAEMQKLLAESDAEMDSVELAEITKIKHELFGLKKDVAIISPARIDKLKHLSPEQLVTILEANYKDETGHWVVEKGDGFDLAKQLALDMLGYYAWNIDSMRWNLSQDAENRYRIAKWLPEMGAEAELIAYFVDDLCRGISGVRPISPSSVSPQSQKILALDPLPSWLYSENNPVQMLKLWNVELKTPITLVTTLPYDTLFTTVYGKKYAWYKDDIYTYALTFWVNPNVFANMLISENPFWDTWNSTRSLIGQMGKNERAQSVAYAKERGVKIGPFTNASTPRKVVDQIKASAAYYAIKHTECADPTDAFEAAQRYHTGDLKSDARARYYASAGNDAILNAYNQHVRWPKVTARNVTAEKYKIWAKLYYATQYAGTGDA